MTKCCVYLRDDTMEKLESAEGLTLSDRINVAITGISSHNKRVNTACFSLSQKAKEVLYKLPWYISASRYVSYLLSERLGIKVQRERRSIKNISLTLDKGIIAYLQELPKHINKSKLISDLIEQECESLSRVEEKSLESGIKRSKKNSYKFSSDMDIVILNVAPLFPSASEFTIFFNSLFHTNISSNSISRRYEAISHKKLRKSHYSSELSGISSKIIKSYYANSTLSVEDFTNRLNDILAPYEQLTPKEVKRIASKLGVKKRSTLIKYNRPNEVIITLPPEEYKRIDKYIPYIRWHLSKIRVPEAVYTYVTNNVNLDANQIVVHLDGDASNNDLSNLRCLSKDEYSNFRKMLGGVRSSYKGLPEALKDTAVVVAKALKLGEKIK